MPDVGRFTTIDPLAEKYNHWSPYTFAGNRVSVYRELEGLEPFEEPFDPMEEEIMRETGESPLIRQARFNPAIPETYRNSNQQPLITPEVIEERITDIEEVVVTGARASRGFIERAIDWIGEQFTGDSSTPQVRQNAAKGAAFENRMGEDIKEQGNTSIQQQITIKPNEPNAKNVKLDYASYKKNGQVQLDEGKSSSTAPLTKNQKAGFPIIQEKGGTVMGKGKPGFPGGTVIPPTTVNVVRPKEIKPN